MRFVNIGTLSSPTIQLPGTALRSSGVELLGSGLGSVSSAALLEAIGQLFRAVGPAGLSVAADPVSPANVEATWADDRRGRVVFTVGEAA